ncbi:CxxH/CxxC protein [Sedimentibacter sp. MB31-C6]|uniref:CxxH/CxxC protein n=1 Tax=Sedimentibacter sp. MB31-C6 TaxID=3109366 RepID=UPI002DDCC2E4|nr:CxxH/CxxC protein [Sedimentibacter sp. MB36-C1]WSI05556.1 CxxH/CxxC protein [Sedimentibacter sp. MB36-C1]
MNEERIYACEEHVEIALDDFLNYEEIAPKIINISDENFKCNYCDNNAYYEILK